MRLLRHRRLVAATSGGGSAFSPASIAGLQLWLDASQITGLNDGDAVGTWADLSGNGNDATQATGSKKPTFETNELNGRPVVRFDGVDDILQTPIFGQFPSKRGTLFLVYKATFGASYKSVLNTITGAGVGFQLEMVKSGVKYKWYDGVADGLAAVFDPAGFDLQTINRTGDTAMDFRRNGTLEVVFTVTNNQPDARVMDVGASALGSYASGDMALLLMYDGSLSAGDVSLVESWINARYLLF